MADERIIMSTESPLNKTFADKFYFIFEMPEALKNLKKVDGIQSDNLGVGKKALQWSIIKAEVPNVNIKANAINYAGTPSTT